MNRLQELGRTGQDIWIDFLDRDLIEDGRLEHLIHACSIGGVTSNPTIFRKAITSSDRYESALCSLAERKAGVRDAFYDLALGDIRMAATLFRPIHNQSCGLNGFVSFELEPNLAHSAEATIAKATEIFAELGRPNVMIKVPGTSEGIVAVEELTRRGVNVNITLLFSVDTYEAVAEAYLRGLERRLEARQPIGHISSVASFFVSRVEAAVDPVLAPDSPIQGKVGIANARLAYERFRRIISGARWKYLASAGARLQRPLWASTGTKNPAYSDVVYVEELIGRDTVITLAEPTLRAFLDHGQVRPQGLSAGEHEAEAVIHQLAAEGVHLEQTAARLLENGLAIFETDLAEAFSIIDGRLRALSSKGWRHGASDQG